VIEVAVYACTTPSRNTEASPLWMVPETAKDQGQPRTHKILKMFSQWLYLHKSVVEFGGGNGVESDHELRSSV
jgi:hypothetical protein